MVKVKKIDSDKWICIPIIDEEKILLIIINDERLLIIFNDTYLINYYLLLFKLIEVSYTSISFVSRSYCIEISIEISIFKFKFLYESSVLV